MLARSRMIGWAVASVLGAGAVAPAAGAAGSPPPIDHSSPRAVALSLLHDDAASDWSGVCSALTLYARQVVVRDSRHGEWPASTCRAAFSYLKLPLSPAQWRQAAKVYAGAYIVAVRRSGDTASVRWGTHAPHRTTPFTPFVTVQKKGRWFIAPASFRGAGKGF